MSKDTLILAAQDNDSECSKDDFVILHRPPFCPITNMTKLQLSQLPDSIINRGINVGVVTIVESEDKVLLIRRPLSQRTFPGIWVPPGGHIEYDEQLQEAGLRELHEETGLKLSRDMCV